MEYTEDDYLMISGIQHFKFCRRQWALIHVEQQWAENVHTAVGKLMHQKVHDPYLTEKRKDTILVRALPVSSRIMGVSGECDLVEFHKCEDGIRLHGHRGMYSVYPVEYKKGRAVLADRFVLSLVNKKIVNGKNFTKKENGAVLMDDELRKKLLVEWQKKKKETITHPFLKEKVEWGMVPYVQAMLLARYLRGDLDSYPVFLWK